MKKLLYFGICLLLFTACVPLNQSIRNDFGRAEGDYNLVKTYPDDFENMLFQPILEKYPFIEKISFLSVDDRAAIELNKHYSDSDNEDLYCAIQDIYNLMNENVESINNDIKNVSSMNGSNKFNEFSLAGETKRLLYFYYEDYFTQPHLMKLTVVDGIVNYDGKAPLLATVEGVPFYKPIEFNFGPFICKHCMDEIDYHQKKLEYATVKKQYPIELSESGQYERSVYSYSTPSKREIQKYEKLMTNIEKESPTIKRFIDEGNMPILLEDNIQLAYLNFDVPTIYIELESTSLNWRSEVDSSLKTFFDTAESIKNLFYYSLYANRLSNKMDFSDLEVLMFRVRVYKDDSTLNYYSMIYEYNINRRPSGELILVNESYVDFEFD